MPMLTIPTTATHNDKGVQLSAHTIRNEPHHDHDQARSPKPLWVTTHPAVRLSIRIQMYHLNLTLLLPYLI